MKNLDVYAKITDNILHQLEQGNVPWHKPWSGGTRRRPRNLVSKRPYHGVNIFLTGCQQYTSPFWLTINQLKKLNGCDFGFCQKQHEHAHVRKGERGTPIVFYKTHDIVHAATATTDEHHDTMFLARYFHVWNVAQVVGIDGKVPVDETIVEHVFTPIEECERVVREMKDPPSIEHRLDQRAYYHAHVDRVQIPKPETFERPVDYYATLFHELAHSTGHAKRLNRETLSQRTSFGDTNYSQEELIAEFAATFVCGAVGIENHVVNNSAAYLQGWAEKLRSDPRLVMQAASAAQKAADRILGIEPETERSEDDGN